jgi:hypothetical protein
MNHKFFTAVLFCALLTSTLFVHAQDASQWRPLFNEDLSNADNAEVWSFEKGILTASEDRCIWTDREYENFILDLEFKHGDGGNSGVLVYCVDTENWVPNALEISIIDHYSEKWKDVPPFWLSGAVFGLQAPSENRLKKPGKWNRMIISCQGQHVTIELNGKLVTDMDKSLWTDPKLNPDGTETTPWVISSRLFADLPTKGKIGLQGKHGAAPIWFRKVKIKVLN